MTSGAAKRGAAKFCGVAVVVGFYLVCVALGNGSPYQLFLWTVAAGVSVRLLWPTQEEGNALIGGD